MTETNMSTDLQIIEYDRNLYPFESNWVNINGNEVHFIDEGNGEVILFCHPPIASSFMYRNMIKILSKKFRCIALDFPGFGLSHPAANYDYSIRSQAQIIEELIGYLSLDPMYLVMQEIGGHAAMLVFMKKPSLLKAVILTDTIIYPVSQYPKIWRMLNIVNSNLFNWVNSNFNLIINRLTSSGIKRRKMSQGEKETYKAMFNNHQIRRISTKLLYQLVEEEELLSRIQQAFTTIFNRKPTLLVYGEFDSLTKLGIPNRIHKLLPNSEIHWIKGEEHFPHEGAPEEMSAIISNWIEKYSNVIQQHVEH
ncbi:MAG TPA: alpha/beta fold hydrolase [Puia sp.]|nr:alpha/beta fold hydrolase [Puia sp.]